ncbi:MAG: tRNA (N(6)-L-threonylcarbamoyladenosine(37)-C(2))-methylthiotransferase MtaB [Dysgonamonadaceae bacterium]|jgi:threonylcarbamoyladenosine tRNA methylthiotransferase MtaB|nr:tRNA (N(6)-L-threonylcarbamoyladenosine(37)-C(2))-methylthiotransferase MtaB [Dysgonamonadaceae bacterium]
MIDKNIFKNKKAAYFTLGCKLNFAETSTIGRQLSEHGVRKVLPGEIADICIINTCSVTEPADKKCRQAIRKICKRHPGAFVVAVGCYAQLKPEEASRIEGVDLVLGTKEKGNILEYFKRNRVGVAVSPAKDIRVFTPSCSKGDRTRYFLKVQDGCDYRCSYCAIPFARGRSRNGQIADLVKMADEAGRDGGKEIVLTGVNIGDFGKSTGETFLNLLKALDGVESVDRFRISSIEPNLLTDDILAFVAQSRRFAPHFHIPLQSGCDEVLKLMRRKYDTQLFAAKIHKIKELLPNAFIGTDVIVGTRGETDEYFETGKRFIQSLPVSQLHVFNYSERQGTAALHIDHRVNPQTRQERSRQLQEISGRKTVDFYRSQVGTSRLALFEHTKKGNKMYGFTENYIKVEADYRIALINRLIPVTLSSFNENEMTMSV